MSNKLDVPSETERPERSYSRSIALSCDPHVLVVGPMRFNFKAEVDVFVAKAAIEYALRPANTAEEDAYTAVRLTVRELQLQAHAEAWARFWGPAQKDS